MNLKFFIILIFSLTTFNTQALDPDSLAYRLYKNRVVLYSSVGYKAAPFSLKNSFLHDVDELKFRHNLKTIVAFGVHYKWFALKLSFALPGTMRSVSRYGSTNYYDLGLQFSIKQTFCDLDARAYRGFTIIDAYKWNDTLNELSPNDIRPNTTAASFSANVWYFKSKDFNMKAVQGRVGHFNRKTTTFYLKSTLNFFGIGNSGKALAPTELIDSLTTSTSAIGVTALDLGVVPGYAYATRIKNWQFSVFAGLGGVIQAKFYTSPILPTARGNLGLAPRMDLKLVGGYSVPNYFVHLVSDFDIKSIRVKEARYAQIYYSLNLVGGVRIKKKPKSKKRI